MQKAGQNIAHLFMNILLYIARPMISLIHLGAVCFRMTRNEYEAWHEKHEVNRLLKCMNMHVKYESGVWELKENKRGQYVSYPAIVKAHRGTLKELLKNIFHAPYFTYTACISKGKYVEFIDKRVENIFHGCVSLDDAKVRRDLHICEK